METCSIDIGKDLGLYTPLGYHWTTGATNYQVNRLKPSVQEYFRVIRDQQVTTDYHLDQLAHGMTPAKKRKNLNHVLYDICVNFNKYDSVLSYMFKVAKYFGHKQ